MWANGSHRIWESEPLAGFFSTNPTECSQKRLKKIVWKCSLWCIPGRGKGQPLRAGPKLHPDRSPLSYYGAKAFICLGTGNKYNQRKDTAKNPLQVGQGEGKGACTPCEREKNICRLRIHLQMGRRTEQATPLIIMDTVPTQWPLMFGLTTIN